MPEFMVNRRDVAHQKVKNMYHPMGPYMNGGANVPPFGAMLPSQQEFFKSLMRSDAAKSH